MFNPKDDTINCSCMLYVHQGVLCRHMFYILNMKEIDQIPSKYILRRWQKDIIGDGILKKKYSYSQYGGKIETLIQDAYGIIRSSINKLVHDEDEFNKFVSQLQELNNGISSCITSTESSSKGDQIEAILGVTVPDVINIQNPVGIKNKGCGTGKRLKSNKEKAVEASKKRLRLCTLCHKPYHNARSCILREGNLERVE